MIVQKKSLFYVRFRTVLGASEEAMPVRLSGHRGTYGGGISLFTAIATCTFHALL